MINIELDDTIQKACPQLRLGCLACSVKVDNNTEALWNHIGPRLADIQSTLNTEDIRHIPTIAHTRTAYKATGKDPARYRPSAEALLRRVVSGKGLYQVNNIVDLLNFVSVTYGFSIGGYDADKIQGKVSLGIGAENEPYEAIGRGTLNIAGLPLFRDQKGAFGSPTSDSVRTMVDHRTNHFLMAIFSFHPEDPLTEAIGLGKDLLMKFGGAESVEEQIVS
jgi:DNA/RNA-binding domain of Phe-tRNA-synthetase-like protein